MILEKIFDWAFSDNGWKISGAVVAACTFIFRRTARQIKRQIENLVTPLEKGIADGKKIGDDNTAEIKALQGAARDQNGANEKSFATKEYVKEYVDTRISNIEKDISSISTNVSGLVGRIDGLFKTILENSK